ncbi:hypothetical protein OSTOST_14392, partial [Ostertagia ostertagi]
GRQCECSSEWKYGERKIYRRYQLNTEWQHDQFAFESTGSVGQKRKKMDIVRTPGDTDGGFATGSMMGSGGFIVLDESQCVVRNTYTLARFYRHESCGQCSPCREGTGWMEKILLNIENGKGKMSDIDLLWDIQRKIEGNTICPLGDAAAWPVAAAIRHFRDEFEWHITNPDDAVKRNYGLMHYADELKVMA